jgi:hypothetical protein
MNLIWGENVFSKIYPLINHLYNEESVIAKPKPFASVIRLKKSVGFEVEKKIQERFVPSFFDKNLCEKASLIGRVSATLFFIFKKLRLHKLFESCNKNSKLFSIVLKAERCWLAQLLNKYDEIKFLPKNSKKHKFIVQHLARVVTAKNEIISNEEIQRRLNELVALTNVFYEIHGSGHNDVTGRMTQTYFKFIFSNI